MLRPRIIPCLLLKNKGLVKTRKFKDPVYIGDPINAVKIFNDKEVDELIFLDISATKDKKKPNFDLIESIATEAFMPFAYGGGIRTIEDAGKILKNGAEKVIINSYALENPFFIKELAEKFGSQSVVVAIDVKKNILGSYIVYSHSGIKMMKVPLIDHCKQFEALGAGEIFINFVDNDGMMEGYDLKLLKMVTESITLPVIACGGAGNINHLADAIHIGKVSAVAAGSLFIFYRSRNAVLINYPNKEEIKKIY
ncbi:MAG: AglZ/HisF2 family acetamidino modification protein [Ignavibacteriaceae bacterium]|jgi:cyclase